MGQFLRQFINTWLLGDTLVVVKVVIQHLLLGSAAAIGDMLETLLMLSLRRLSHRMVWPFDGKNLILG
jgi:hypothetical protein